MLPLAFVKGVQRGLSTGTHTCCALGSMASIYLPAKRSWRIEAPFCDMCPRRGVGSRTLHTKSSSLSLSRRRLNRLSSRLYESIEVSSHDGRPSISRRRAGKGKQKVNQSDEMFSSNAKEAPEHKHFGKEAVRFFRERMERNSSRSRAEKNSQRRGQRDSSNIEAAEVSVINSVDQLKGKRLRGDRPMEKIVQDALGNSKSEKGRTDRTKASPSASRPNPITELYNGKEAEDLRKVKPSTSAELGQQVSSSQYLPRSKIPDQSSAEYDEWNKTHKWTTAVGGLLDSSDVPLRRVEPLREMQVSHLAHGLDRVLFNPGVHWLRDPRTGIYNFEPKIRDLYDVDLFDYAALPSYLTSSIDPELAKIANKRRKKFSGSTSSLTGLLSHIYFCVSANKQPELKGFSEGFAKQPKGFSFGARLPASVILRRFEETEENGSVHVRYAVDNDKSASGEGENSNYVLTQLGKSVEKLLTSRLEEYEKYLRVNSHELTEQERTRKEAYYYSETDQFLMRSQLDCCDERLPRRTFDLKTRAVIAVRQDRANWVESSGYMIRHTNGVFESFEREMWDMTRSAFLKYFFQARIGNMDGILVAYHSTATMYGFQYVPLEDIAQKLFSSEEMGEQAFLLSVGMLERILESITRIYSHDSLRVTFDTQLGDDPKLLIFVQTEGGEANETDQNDRLMQFDVQVDRYLSDSLVKGPIDFNAPKGHGIDASSEDEISRRRRAKLPPLKWNIEYSIQPRSDLSMEVTQANLAKVRSRQALVAPLIMPNVRAINERERQREKALSQNQDALARYLRERETGVAIGMPPAPGQVPAGFYAQELSLDSETSASNGIHVVSVDDGDTAAAQANLDEEIAQPTSQRWTQQTERVERLRQLSRLGKQDKETQDKVDTFQMYERKGE